MIHKGKDESPGRQKSPDWIPSPKQVKVLQAAQEIGFDRGIREICRKAGVTHKSFYEWLKNDPDFAAAWRELPWEMIGHHLPGITSAVIKKAQGGDVQAARLIADLLGLIKQKREISGSVGLEDLLSDAGEEETR
jgi:hypothetical protein